MLSSARYGPWAIVGGGSEGIGLAFGKQIARAGINVVLVGRTAETLHEAAREVRKDCNVQVRELQVDLASPSALEQLRAGTNDLTIGLLVFNAAAANFKPLLEQSEDELLAAVRLSCIGQSLIVQYFAKHMVARQQGGIVLVGSLAGNAGIPNMAAYSGAKAYTQLFGEALWAELKPQGVDVFVLVVGSTDTPRRRRSGAGNVPGIPVLQPDEVVSHALDHITEGPTQVPPPLQPMFEKVCSAKRREVVQTPRAAVQASNKIF